MFYFKRLLAYSSRSLFCTIKRLTSIILGGCNRHTQHRTFNASESMAYVNRILALFDPNIGTCGIKVNTNIVIQTVV